MPEVATGLIIAGVNPLDTACFAVTVLFAFSCATAPAPPPKTAPATAPKTAEVPQCPDFDPLSTETPPETLTACEAACNAGNARACQDVGDTFITDSEKSAPFYEKGCALGLAEACNGLGVALTMATNRDCARARTFFQKACDGGSEPGCTNLALAATCEKEVARRAPAEATTAVAPLTGESVRVRGVGVHQAAMFVADLFQVNVVVLGGSDQPIDVDVDPAEAESALRALASKAGLEVSKHGSLWLLAPSQHTPKEVTPLKLGSTRRVTIQLVRSETKSWAPLFEKVLATSLKNAPQGELTIHVRNFDARALFDVIASATRGAATDGGFHDNAKLPAITGAAPVAACEQSEEDTGTLLHCVDETQLRLCGLGMHRERPKALLCPTTPPNARAAIVQKHHHVARERRRVLQIGADSIELGGTKLVLRALGR